MIFKLGKRHLNLRTILTCLLYSSEEFNIRHCAIKDKVTAGTWEFFSIYHKANYISSDVTECWHIVRKIKLKQVLIYENKLDDSMIQGQGYHGTCNSNT